MNAAMELQTVPVPEEQLENQQDSQLLSTVEEKEKTGQHLALQLVKDGAPTKVVDAVPLSYIISNEKLQKMMEAKKWDALKIPMDPSAEDFSAMPLSERMQGWIIEQRPRKDGRYDKYYYHKKSEKMFRSSVTMQIFMKFGIFTKRSQMRGKRKEQESTEQTPLKRPEGSAWAYDAYDEQNQEMYFSLINYNYKGKNVAVMKFLSEAYNNLLMSAGTKKKKKKMRIHDREGRSSAAAAAAPSPQPNSDSVVDVLDESVLIDNPVSYCFEL